MFPLISLMILFPFIGFALLMVMPARRNLNRLTAVFFSGISLALGAYMLIAFNYGNPIMQMTESYTWINTAYFPITFSVGVDGIGLPMVFLSVLLSFLVVVFSWDINHRSNQYFAMLMLTEVGVLGVFTVTNYFVFYLFWEAVLIPMFFIILIWGSARRVYSATKFFIYTHASSLVMLLSFFALYFEYHQLSPTHAFTFDMVAINKLSPTFPAFFQLIVFIGLFFGFIVKMPVFPFHTWLPDAHTDAPTGGSVLLAGLLIKMGSFGIIRIAIPALPLGAKMIEDWIVLLAVVSILYGAWVSMAQKDIKRMIANSSISHMGLVLLAIAASVFTLNDTNGWSMNTIGISVADFQMFAHGLITSVLFMSAGVIQHHTGTRDMDKLGGLGKHMPALSTFMMAGFLASLGLPGMVGFAAEFSVFYVTYLSFNVYLIIPILTVVITLGYYVWALQRTIFGPESGKLDYSRIHDSNWFEILPMAILIIVIIIFGIIPWAILNPISGSVAHWYSFLGGVTV